MAVHPLSWLLRLAVLCHLALLLAGQQHSVGKCRDMCNAMAMTREIPLRLLKSYRPTEASCRTPAIILTTKGNRTFCADPKEDWVQKAMQHLNRTASPFHERQVDPKTSPSTRGTDRSPASEPTATAESSSQGSRLSAPTSPAPDGGPSGTTVVPSTNASRPGPSAHPLRPHRVLWSRRSRQSPGRLRC
uniref:Chemokine interleukin-8-like domain-containing protein n=1 Tax=Myotis myotis TaxID=51298 RepID=A0A7J7SCW3_MYOMY|nr:hypothetical protein mMyoMyo1_009538 [Myotis myotis]